MNRCGFTHFRPLTVIAIIGVLLVPHHQLLADDPPQGSLVIVGGGGMPAAVRDAFIAKAGGAAVARIVVIPTASAAADDVQEHAGFLRPWQAAGIAEVKLLHTRDPQQANTDDFVKPLLNATGIWFSGGDQSRLTKTYADTKVLDVIRKRYAEGAVIGGTSAGAAVVSEVMITGGRERARTAAGFGLLPGTVIDQHFTQRRREKRLASVLTDHPKHLGIGIDESTAVVVSGGVASVYGTGAVTFLTGGQAEAVTLHAGERYDLSARAKK